MERSFEKPPRAGGGCASWSTSSSGWRRWGGCAERLRRRRLSSPRVRVQGRANTAVSMAIDERRSADSLAHSPGRNGGSLGLVRVTLPAEAGYEFFREVRKPLALPTCVAPSLKRVQLAGPVFRSVDHCSVRTRL